VARWPRGSAGARVGSEFVANGTFIGLLTQDHFLHIAPGAHIDITLAGLGAGTYRFEGWWSDVLQGPGLVYQHLEVSTPTAARPLRQSIAPSIRLAPMHRRSWLSSLRMACKTS